MSQRLQKLFCFIFGHNMHSLYSLNNAEIMGGVARSSWGMHKCFRCGLEEHWQYDHY